jgi:hypothetical protein
MFSGLVWLVGVRSVYLFAQYVLSFGNVQRFQVETSVLIFVAIALTVRALRDRQRPSPPASDAPPAELAWLPAFVAIALALYWPALRIGLLSDDFVLTGRAAQWRFGAVSAELFRPVPLFAWAALLSAGASAAVLHVLNIVLHGVNAFLVARAVRPFAPSAWVGLFAGGVFLTTPIGPEAVAWCSGIFDVLATTLLLLSLLCSRSYGSRPAVRTRILFVGLCVAALFTKETAAVAVGFVFADMLLTDRPRLRVIDAAAIACGVTLFGVIRLTRTFGVTAPPFSKYVIQRALFGGFGGFMDPWHEGVIARYVWLPIVMAAALALMFALFATSDDRFNRMRPIVVACAWLLLPLIPVLPVVYVGRDLQQSRYLYMPLIGWSALIGVLATAGRWRVVTGLAMATILAVAVAGTRLHLRPWTEAAAERDRVLAAAAPFASACARLELLDLPDNVQGAYVFRNGGVEAIRGLAGTQRAPGPSADVCRLEWNGEKKEFRRVN